MFHLKVMLKLHNHVYRYDVGAILCRILTACDYQHDARSV